MGRKGITYQDTKAAIERLLAQQERPTIARIRAELGHTGSITTIGRFKRQWEEEQAERLHPMRPPLPDPLAKRLLAGAEEYWSELMEALAAREQELEANAAQAVAQAHRAAQQARDERDTMQRMNESLGRELEQAHARIDELINQLNDTNTKFQREMARCEGLEHLNAELEDRIEDYRARLTRSEQLRAEQAQQYQKALVEERKNARMVYASLERQVREAEQKAQTAQAHLDQARQENIALLARNEAERASFAAQLEALRAECAQLTETNRAQLAELARQQGAIARLTESLSQAKEALKAEQTARHSEKAEYERRVQELFGELIRLQEQHRLLQATRRKRTDASKPGPL